MQKYLLISKKSSTFALAFAQWCNGSTTDSGSVCLGSSPGWATKSDKYWPRGVFRQKGRVKIVSKNFSELKSADISDDASAFFNLLFSALLVCVQSYWVYSNTYDYSNYRPPMTNLAEFCSCHPCTCHKGQQKYNRPNRQ